MNRYTVSPNVPQPVIARTPDLPGCITAGATLDETRQLIKEAFEFHIEGMRLNGETVPEPTTLVEQVDVPA